MVTALPSAHHHRRLRTTGGDRCAGVAHDGVSGVVLAAHLDAWRSNGRFSPQRGGHCRADSARSPRHPGRKLESWSSLLGGTVRKRAALCRGELAGRRGICRRSLIARMAPRAGSGRLAAYLRNRGQERHSVGHAEAGTGIPAHRGAEPSIVAGHDIAKTCRWRTLRRGIEQGMQ